MQQGARVTVDGRNFGQDELITLSLDGEALTTSPATIRSTQQGRFRASFVAPHALLPGRNTVAAAGALSGHTAVAPLSGSPGVASQFYFAGGESSAYVHAYLTLLNTAQRPVQVRLTFYSVGGARRTRTLTIGKTRERSLAVADYVAHPGPFGLAVRVDHAIAATLSLTRPGRDGDLLLGSSDLATHWYLAEGYTSLTFRETVALLNPGATAARVTLHLQPLGGRHARTVIVRVAPHSEAIADVNRLLPHRALSVTADSDHPVVVARTLTFSADRAGRGFGLTLRTGSTAAATTWLFAEGSTLGGFQTFLTVLNANRRAAHLTAQFYDSGGHRLGRRTLVAAAHSRLTLKLNQVIRASGIASVVSSDRPVVIERAEYFGSPNSPHIAGSDVYGRNGPAVRWSFPGGYGRGLSEFLLLYNPSAVSIPITARFYGQSEQTRVYHVVLRPHVRLTIAVRRVARQFATEHGVTLEATNGQGFVAEQTLFSPDHRTLLSTQGFAQ